MKFLSQINVNTEYTLPIVDGTNGQVLTTDGSGSVYWGTVSTGVTNLNGLTDVDITSPQVDQILAYRIPLGETLPRWVNITSPYATIASPAFTGSPTAPTPATSSNSTLIATTAFVKNQGYLTQHPTISAASSINNSNGVVIQDVTLDANGHVTAFGTINLDTRYYLESEINSFFSGGTVIAGYNKSNWDSAYNDTITSASFNTSNGVITLTQRDAGTVTVDIDGRFLTAEVDTLDSVTSRDNETGNSIIVGGATSDYYIISPDATPTPSTGMLSWNTADDTANLQLASGASLQIGQEQHWYVKNSTGITIPNGTVVMAVGTDGNSGHILAAPMVADGTVEERYVLGVATGNIANGGFGHVTSFGKVRKIDTSAFEEGAVLYCDSTVPGGLTDIQPVAPNLNIPIAFVISSHAINGILAVRVLPGYHLGELHDVNIGTSSTGQLLRYNSNRWENWTPNYLTSINSSMVTTALGYTPVTNARTLTINGTTYDLTANRTWTISNISGYANTLINEDNRIISPSELSAGRLKFGFTSWNNNNTTPYADFLHLRSYTDASGGSDNLVMFLKSGIGMRIWQQAWGNSGAYSTYKDVAFTDSNITGNAATATTLQTARTLTIGNTGKTFNGGANVSWTLAEIGAYASTNPSGFITSAGLDGYATEQYVDDALANLVDTAPDALNTLNELAAALGDDPNFATTVTTALGSKAPLASPALTGTPTAPTAATATNSTQIATTAFVKNQGYLTTESDTLATVTGRGASTSTAVTFNGNVTLGNAADLRFVDLAGTFPTSGKGFDWTLNNDGARIYAIQPSSDSIDLVFQLRDNATTNDRFVFWVDDYQGAAFDKYPLVIRGGTEFDLVDSGLFVRGTQVLTNARNLQNVSGNISMFTNDSGYITSSASITGNAATATTLATARTLTIGNTGKSFNGSANVSWTLAEIGALGVSDTAADSNKLGGVAAASYALLASPALTGTPTAPTAATATNNTQIATTAFVKAQGYLTSYSETDTLATVTGRGATTSTTLNLARVVTTGLYGPGTSGNIPIWQFNAGNPGYGIVYFEGSPDLLRFDVSGDALSGTPDFLIGPNYAQVNGNNVWHAGNDGSGSGLDADLLDGQHASAFSLVGHTHDAADIVSGTFVTELIPDLSGTYSLVGHTHSATDITSGTLASARLSGTYAISVSGSAATLTNARTLTIGATGKTFNGSANVSWTLAEIGALGATAKAADSELLDGQDSTAFFRLISGVAGTSLDTVTANGFTVASYTGYSSQIWNINTGGSTGTVQMEFEYNTPTRGFKIRNRTDNTNWSSTGWVVMTTANQGHISGTLLHSGNYNSYSPTLTGTGASGTWGINVTGSAATLTTARTLTIGNTGKSFNGSANVSWSLAEIGAYAATNPSGFITAAALDGYATESYVDDALAALVDTAPDALNTLNELAAALGDDPSFATTVSTNIGTKVSKSGDTMTGNLSFGSATRQMINLWSTSYGIGVQSNTQYFRTGSGFAWFRGGVHSDTANDAGSGGVVAMRMDGSSNLTVTGTISASNFSGSSSGTNTGDQTTITGNAGSATVLQTARTINGTSFNGSANITTTTWGAARTITIGSTGKSVNGSANVSWTLAEIGALGATAKAADSELLDGIDSTGFVRQLSDGSSPDYQTPSSRRVNPNASNPTNEHYAVITYGNNGNVTGQLATHYQTGNLYSRGYNSSWSAWRRYWNDTDFTSTNISNWNTAFGWGNHATYDYWVIGDTDTKSVASLSVRFQGDVEVQGTFTETSSIRFKENIKTLEPTLGKVEQLNPVTYNKIGVEEEEIGLIAEEVSELFPEVVTYNENGEATGIQYQRLSVILLKAMQELTERVNKLENK